MANEPRLLAEFRGSCAFHPAGDKCDSHRTPLHGSYGQLKVE
jgi:hypothetical protein